MRLRWRATATRRALSACAALGWLVCAWTARAETTARPDGEPLPGERVESAFRQSLTTPAPEARWRGLPVFGREWFTGRDSSLAPVSGAVVGPDYVLGPGDNLVVFVSGLRDTSYALTLDRDGQVFLPRVWTTSLWGLSFADAERLIQSRLSTVLRNARVQISMGRVRAVEVFVLGAVVKPGKVTLAGMATALNALIAAGGPNALGSLRDVRVRRADLEVARLDLYPFLVAGDRRQDVRLQSGDVVFVELVKQRVGVQGEVVRPGVYEASEPLSLRALLALAGGPTPLADLTRVRIERVDPNGGFRLEDVALDHGHGIDPDSLRLFDFDLVTVLPLAERMRNLVTLDGYVRHPGEYQLLPGMKLSDLIGGDRLLPEADLEHGELRRVDLATFHVEVRAFSPRRVRAGEEDGPLQPMDGVTVFSSARLPSTVSLEGEVTRPGAYTITPGERMSDVLTRAGGVTPRGSLRAAVFRRRSAARDEASVTRGLDERQRIELARRRIEWIAAGDSSGAAEAERAQAELLGRLDRQTEPGRVVLDLDAQGRWMRTGKDPMLEDGDRLIVPIEPATVAVLGNVMNPGALIARRAAGAAAYVRRAGGLARDADLGRSYVLRANGEAEPYRGGARVLPGDAVVVIPRTHAPGFGRALVGGTRFVFEMAAAAGVILAATR
ncbi:MAG: hypothetical protein E6K80_11120 [Candidatus Eisenbacteria bacterium]|uniref:Polysaccharide export protein n=1 Tax=Eiseniibacteriota bacterium TaxID=2212470 RepID=A0A538U139_UNCEI|nr:MAG: hypothetical protein E6K80_11120 [Candidatus Eisenbacteria bacterium]